MEAYCTDVLPSRYPPWYRAEFFPNTARAEYRVVVNGRPRLDPHNRRVCRSETGNHSDYNARLRPTARDCEKGVVSRVAIEQHWMKSDFFTGTPYFLDLLSTWIVRTKNIWWHISMMVMAT